MASFPSDDELISAILRIQAAGPKPQTKRLQEQLKADNGWHELTQTRIKKILASPKYLDAKISGADPLPVKNEKTGAQAPTLTSSSSSITPSDDEVIDGILRLHATGRTGPAKMLREQLAVDNGWRGLTANRVKKILQSPQFKEAEARQGAIPPHVEDDKTGARKLASADSSSSPPKPTEEQLHVLDDLEKAIDGYDVESYPSYPVHDLVASLHNLHQAMERYPIFPRSLLSLDPLADEDTSGLLPPSIPEDAFQAQIRYREESTRHLIIYGRGEHNYGVSPNSSEAHYYDAIFNPETYPAMGSNPKTQEEFADMPPIRVLWEFYETSARAAGVARADVGRQFEAEWGVNMHTMLPPRSSQVPEIRRVIEKWEQKRADIYRQNLYPILQSLHARRLCQLPVDEDGQVVWQSHKNDQFSVLVMKIDKETGQECGLS